jgi:hypothetical protein
VELSVTPLLAQTVFSIHAKQYFGSVEVIEIDFWGNGTRWVANVEMETNARFTKGLHVYD